MNLLDHPSSSQPIYNVNMNVNSAACRKRDNYILLRDIYADTELCSDEDVQPGACVRSIATHSDSFNTFIHQLKDVTQKLT